MPSDHIVDSTPPLTFPDMPRMELDQLLAQLVARAQEVMGTQGRLRGLLAAIQSIISDPELPTVLRRITAAARELVGARYAALGVSDGHGGLAEFVHVGMPDAVVAAVGHLPQGKGLLGALIDDPRPVSLADLAQHPRSAGFPPEHPPMGSFLGVPIRIRDEVFGNLYLTESERGGFSDEDEHLVVALAATAAVVIDNARHYAAVSRQGQWLAATADVTRQMLAATTDPSPLQTIAEHAFALADADLVAVLLPEDQTRQVLRVETAVGSRRTAAQADGLVGRRSPIGTSLCAYVFDTGHPLRLNDAHDHPGLPPAVLAEVVDVGPVLVAPLTGSEQTRGVLAVARMAGRHPFQPEDLQLAAAFANQASIALEVSEARLERERAALLDERDRIAADLHDRVVQRLFGAGLTLHGVASRSADKAVVDGAAEVVHALDDAITELRSSIFGFRSGADPTEEPPSR